LKQQKKAQKAGNKRKKSNKKQATRDQPLDQNKFMLPCSLALKINKEGSTTSRDFD
jgi:hypothetical protein